MGAGIWVVSSDRPAQPLYFFFQCNSGCQGPLVGLPCFSKFNFSWSASPPPWGSVLHQVSISKFWLSPSPWQLILFPPQAAFQRGHHIPHQFTCPFQPTWQRSGQSPEFIYLVIEVPDLFSAGTGPNCIGQQRHPPAGLNMGGHASSLDISFILPPFFCNKQHEEIFLGESGSGVAPPPPNVGIHPKTYQSPCTTPSVWSSSPLYLPTPWWWGLYLLSP